MKGTRQRRGGFSGMITSQGRVRLERGTPQSAWLGQHRDTAAPTVGTPEILRHLLPALPSIPVLPCPVPCTQEQTPILAELNEAALQEVTSLCLCTCL